MATRDKLSASSGLTERIMAGEAIRRTTIGRELTEEQIKLVRDLINAGKTESKSTLDDDFNPTTGGTSSKPPVQEEQPALEVDTNLQILISSIPRANPGDIIGSEYHNSLRDAVRGLASRIGLSVNPVAEFKTLTFSPTFLPTNQRNSTVQNKNWVISLNRALVPDDAGVGLVSGGMMLQLPDDTAIFKLVVRGTRLATGTATGAATPNPANFTINLNRVTLGKELLEITPLITLDLKTLPDGGFTKEGEIQLTDDEKGKLLNSSLFVAAATVERQIVNNQKWAYTVTAEWTGGVAGAAKFEINSIQIFCRA